MYKINTLDDGQKDFKEIFNNLDEYIKNNRKHGGVKIEEETEEDKKSKDKEIYINKSEINNSKININNTTNDSEDRNAVHNEYQKANND